MAQKIRALHSTVVIKRDEAPKPMSAAGIILPSTDKETPNTGVVVAVGPGSWRDGRHIQCSVTIGDRVVLGQYTGNTVKINGEPFMMVTDGEIFAVLSEKEEIAVEDGA